MSGSLTRTAGPVYTAPAMRAFLAMAPLLLAAAACTVEREQPNLVGQDIRLTLIHTSDIHSRLFPYQTQPNRFEQEDGLLAANAPFGGIARMATIAQGIRATSGRSLWLDSGDCFQGAPVFNMFKGEAELRALSLAGLDGAVIGNHEFDLGSANLYEQMSQWAQFPMLAANYEWEDSINPDARSLKDIVAPYHIYDVDGLKIGVIGLANYGSMTGIFEGGNSLGIRPVDYVQVVNKYVALLRPVVDVLILDSHLGLDEDEGLAASETSDENELLPLAGVDIILGGHLHIVTNPPKVLPNDDEGHNTVLVHSGAFAKWVGRLDLVIKVGDDNSDPDRRSRVTAFTYESIPVDARTPDDPAVTELLWPYSVAINQQLDLDGVFAYNETVGTKILRNDLSGGDSQLGNLVARAMQTRPGVEAEFALTNSLGVRADFEPGPLTVEQMYNVFPFENSITVMYLSGLEIQETLDFVARKSAERGCRTQAQVAGIWFDMVCNGACEDTSPDDGFTPTACAKNIVLGENCRGGDPDGEIDFDLCREVLPTGLYRVAVNDYIAKGGSGFSVLKRNTSKQDTGVGLRDALMVYLRQAASCTTDTVVEQYGEIPCLTPQADDPENAIEAHDGRIRPVVE